MKRVEACLEVVGVGMFKRNREKVETVRVSSMSQEFRKEIG